MPGWTWIDESKEEDSAEEGIDRYPVLDDLARQWTNLHTEEERRGWDRQSRYEAGEYDGPDYDTDEEARQAEFEQTQREQLRRARHDAEVQVIEDAMSRLGARIMRPYEHWNEDEALMAWMERDRD